MDNKKIVPIYNQNLCPKTNEAKQNLSESGITTSNSSVSSNKNYFIYSNHKTPKKKNYQKPSQKNTKPVNQNSVISNNTKIYSKGIVKKNSENSKHTNSNTNNYSTKLCNRSMSQVSIEHPKNHQNTNNHLVNNKNQFLPTPENNLASSTNNNTICENQNNDFINNNPGFGRINMNKKRININNKELVDDNSNHFFSDDNENYDNDNYNINNIINENSSNEIPNNIKSSEIYKNNILSKKTLLKNCSSQIKSGYYSESEKMIEKSAILNIEEILMTEEKLSSIINCIENYSPCAEECFEWFNFYYNTSLSHNIEKYFIREEYAMIIRIAVNLNAFSIMLCYDISFHEEFFSQLKAILNKIMNYNHLILIFISKYFSNKILERNIWVEKLEELIRKYDPRPKIKNTLQIMEEINNYCTALKKILMNILQIYPRKEFILIFNKIDYLSSNDLNTIYREKIHHNINQNGSIFASSTYFKNNKSKFSLPVPFLDNKCNKSYTLVLDLDETLIHFKSNPNDDSSGTLQIRPYLFRFLDEVCSDYELIVFTAATQDYADPIINAIESKKKYFERRLYRMHTVIIDNDFVKDLSKLGRDLNKTIIVDNMKQNYKLQPNNGITIRPFWGKDNEDTALICLLEILKKIADKKVDVITGLRLFKEDIISKVSSNIFRRSQIY